MLSPISSVNRISALTESSINLLLGTRSVERLKMNKHASHTTRVPACPADSGQTVFRCCSQRVFCSGISWIKRTSPRRRARRPLTRGAEGTAPAAAGTGRDGNRTRRGRDGTAQDGNGTAPRAALRPSPSTHPPRCWGEKRQESGRQENKMGKGNRRSGK